MRMDPSRGPSAADVVNAMDESDLADVIYKYGEERRSRAVARAIVGARAEARIETTGQLADIVRSVVRRAKDGIDPATRTFQGLRIHVNDELGELERGLEAAERLLSPEGRLVVVSFHSLEDRIVKQFLRDAANATPRGSRHLPEVQPLSPPRFGDLSKAIRPSKAEIDRNPRARSSTLRAATRTGAPPLQRKDMAA